MTVLCVRMGALPPVPSRVSTAVQRKIEAGDFYDAQQLVKTFASRYNTKGQPDVAVSICLGFAPQFAEKHRGALTLDLAYAAMQYLQQQEDPPTDEQLEVIASLLGIATSRPEGGPTVKDVSRYVSSAVKWSLRIPNSTVGSLLIHNKAAIAYSRLGNYGLAQGHCIYGGDSHAMAEIVSLSADGCLLRTWTPQGYPSESGFFWLRAVLMLLCVKRTDVAESLLMNHSDVDWR
ncbi:hypothetical protein cyc_03146 [Cyclospora cayetanensis]|uniref:Uncharacterized protein n=1 Tax=Cyclospora cayetanensis TaxID=88456 RepID=A0A1D3D7A6_9EIME|nr:hypothetical protein cyc_03146 [Cyclospora cayetanensis]